MEKIRMIISYKYHNLLDYVLDGLQLYSSDYFNEIDVGCNTVVRFDVFYDPSIDLSFAIICASIELCRFITLIMQIFKQIKQKGFYELFLVYKSRILISLINYGFIYVIYIILKLFN